MGFCAVVCWPHHRWPCGCSFSDELYGDFEDLETGDVHKGKPGSDAQVSPSQLHPAAPWSLLVRSTVQVATCVTHRPAERVLPKGEVQDRQKSSTSSFSVFYTTPPAPSCHGCLPIPYNFLFMEVFIFAPLLFLLPSSPLTKCKCHLKKTSFLFSLKCPWSISGSLWVAHISVTQAFQV